VIYSGILPITKDDAGLATVMGHEVSHALANHGAQRMRDNFNKLLVPVFLLQLQDKVKNTTNMESSLWCWFTSRVMLPLVEIMKLRRIK
jgi:predicted Zn-dependent protease